MQEQEMKSEKKGGFKTFAPMLTVPAREAVYLWVYLLQGWACSAIKETGKCGQYW